ncbi:MAG: OmpH family outer membrane protein [Acidobacteria bacterium]|nr:OmpH family outer membrane protein [Acidobacteriota bacterium]
MKRSMLLLFLITSLSVCGLAKMGFVDSNRAFVETAEGKAEMQKIKDWATQQQDAINAMKTEFNEKRQQLQSQQNMLSEAKKAALAVEIDDLGTRIRRTEEDSQTEYERRLNEFARAMEKKFSPLFFRYAQDNGYDVVFYLNRQTVSQVIAYYSEELDLTDEIIRLYNQTYPPAE